MIIDEAGMADTLSLDATVQFAINHLNNSVRLIGDDQQLAAIGAGEALRDITHSHGALRTTELHHFTNPDEAAASLRLREGKPEALSTILITAAFMSGTWPPQLRMRSTLGFPTERLGSTRSCSPHPPAGRRTQPSRARDLRLNGHTPDAVVRLGDGNRRRGDVIITRTNDRRLRLTASDWVKNGDRWTITRIEQKGDLKVRHNRSHLIVRLPLDYVRTSTGLGYAVTTIRTAPKVSRPTPCTAC